MLTRRHFISTTAALATMPLASPALAAKTDRSMWDTWDAQVTPANFDLTTSNPWGLHRRLMPQRVSRNPGLTPGDIHVDAKARFLYHIEEGGTAMRYGVAIARDELYTPGVYRLGRKAKWPTWTPTANMIKREPGTYAQHASGMDAGPENPLGSRALYLYRGSRDTYLRIHGSPNPRSIGGRASSGCVRMVMAHINVLYENVKSGVTVHLHPAQRFESEDFEL